MSSTPHKRLPHLAAFAAEPIVFFTAVAWGRRPLFADEEVHRLLHGLWARSSDMNGWWVGDYVLMPDHVHLFARASRNADSTAAWVAMWKSVSSRHIQRIRSLEGPVWQKDYFDRYLRSAENYSEKWAYVEQNPVRAGLVTVPEQWPYRGRIHDLRY